MIFGGICAENCVFSLGCSFLNSVFGNLTNCVFGSKFHFLFCFFFYERLICAFVEGIYGNVIRILRGIGNSGFLFVGKSAILVVRICRQFFFENVVIRLFGCLRYKCFFGGGKVAVLFCNNRFILFCVLGGINALVFGLDDGIVSFESELFFQFIAFDVADIALFCFRVGFCLIYLGSENLVVAFFGEIIVAITNVRIVKLLVLAEILVLADGLKSA